MKVLFKNTMVQCHYFNFIKFYNLYANRITKLIKYSETNKFKNSNKIH
jgi:hypothetical protein